MSNEWINRWDERYSQGEYAYGEAPNNYLKNELDKLTPGTILFPAEGEGRNAVYAAINGWDVAAFDISVEGQKKALQLAAKHNVEINYWVGALETLPLAENQFDALALIYAHFPADIKSSYHKTLSSFLHKGGIVIFEAFSKKHIDYIAKNEKVGGPRDIASLFSIEEIQADFSDFDIITLEEVEIELNEGIYHNGTGSVIRFVGKKK